MGGVGMLSAGFLGGPGIGYKQDYYASGELKQKSPDTYARYVSEDKNAFLIFPAIAGLDGKKVATLEDKGADLEKRIKILESERKQISDDPKLAALVAWWNDAKAFASQDEKLVKEAGIYGGRMALIWTAVVPAAMAVGFLFLFAYFAMTGGYQAVELHDHHPKGEEFTGGVPGPVR
jgi:hypothetical protein